MLKIIVYFITIVASSAFLNVRNVVDLAFEYYQDKYQRQRRNFVNIEDAFLRNNNGGDFYEDMLKGCFTFRRK
jgi:hypothetical protein